MKKLLLLTTLAMLPLNVWADEGGAPAPWSGDHAKLSNDSEEMWQEAPKEQEGKWQEENAANEHWEPNHADWEWSE